MKKISVIIPTYNERDCISKTIDTLKGHLAQHFGRDWEIIVVDDGSKDGTFSNLFYRNDIVLLSHKTNRGKGQAIKTGCSYALGEIIAYIDADFELPPILLYYMSTKLDSTYSCVVGCKINKESRVKYGWFRWFTCLGYFALVKFLFRMPLRDTQTGIKVFKAEAINKVLPNVKSERFTFDVELLLRLHEAGYRIKEYPVVMLGQRKGRIGVRQIVRMLIDTVRIRRKVC